MPTPPAPTSPPPAGLVAAAEAADAVSFDVFDTLFVRPLVDPEDLFDILAERFAIPDFRARRRAAQTEAFRRMHAAGRGEIDLDGIYAALDGAGLNGATPAALREAEYALELALTLPNREITELFRGLVAAGKPVVLASDMYLPEGFFRELLARHGLPAVPLLISSARDATKRDRGALFDLVAGELGLPPGRILHVGDNPVSDIERAREKGFRTYLYDDPRRAKLAARAGAADPGSAGPGASLAAALFRTHRGEMADDLYALGYRYGGPGAVGFLDWVTRAAREDGVELLLLLSRDGYILDRIGVERADGDAADPAPAPPPFASRYFRGSRTAFALAGMDERNFPAHLDLLVSGSPGLSAFELFERIGVTPPAESVLDDLGFGPDVLIGPHLFERLRALLHAFRWEILRVCRRNRNGLFRTLLALGVRPGMRVGFVDVGWNGTSQEAFASALDAVRLPVELHGYYLCLADTPESARRRETLRMRAMVEPPAPDRAARARRPGDALHDRLHDRLYDHRVLVELFFSAPHGAVIGYAEGEDGGARAVEDPGRTPSPGLSEAVEELGRGMRDFARDYRAVCRSAAFEPRPLDAARPFLDFAVDPPAEALRHLEALRGFDAWASSRNHAVSVGDHLGEARGARR